MVVWSDFVLRLQTIQTEKQTDLGLLLNPQLEKLPLPIQRYDDPFLPFGKQIIDATQAVVCVYIFDFASYLALGAAGTVALERTIAYARKSHITVLHGPFATDAYSAMTDATAFGVDAITLTNRASLKYYLSNPPYAAFITINGEADLPERGGLFNTSTNTMIFRNQANMTHKIRLVGEEALYAGKLDGFAQKTQDYLKSLLE